MRETYTMQNMILPVWEWGDALDFIAHQYPHRYRDFASSIRKNQWISKTWLVEHLSTINDKENPVIWVLGSWYGTVIVPLLFNKIPNIKEIHLFDYDEEVFKICHLIHSKWGNKIHRHCADINFMLHPDDKLTRPDIAINTSCEHMWPMRDFKVKHKDVLWAVQSNNYEPEPAHINCVQSAKELTEQSGISFVEYEGEIKFHDADDDYKRFMSIGYRDA